MKIVVAALYKFVKLANYRALRDQLQDLCQKNDIRGTLLLAPEGLNGTIAGTREAIDHLQTFLKNKGLFEGLEYKESSVDYYPFYRLKVRLKKEIVTLGMPHLDVEKSTGTFVEPEEWNALISDPDMLLIDTRNTYETKIGTFKNAVDPETETFREFPEFVEHFIQQKKKQRIAMFCTGGIRCEKASSYLLEQGFEEVYQLKGGILKYLETIPTEESLWQGECFVFDNRVAVKEGVEEGQHDLCFGCRAPLSEADKISSDYEEGVTCPSCFAHHGEDKKKRLRERQKQIMLAKQRQEQHIGRSVSKRVSS
ncbi:MAG: rhodanese-related sulfurtransferase [Candidatus Paracaedimonas acanthamoebae]|uniref:tRNA uridine(34) hydroxylase n=1 Tax=Candidatus Paracaedimonas acanthamoebae TaxID=244581 RepID=A0A8J7TU80_9PROT|nr:rhodanese-related sulfurtransferase [Candidatus Paracaedimonas acanthamoebae]